MRVGVLSDTHGTLPPEIDEVFAGVEYIIHAGDVGAAWIIDHLESIAPVVAVRGNMDSGDLEWRLLDTAVLRLGGYRILVTHIAGRGPHGDLQGSTDIVISGHTHRAVVERAGDVLHVNPGSAGGRGRDGRSTTVALLDLAADPPNAEIIEL